MYWICLIIYYLLYLTKNPIVCQTYMRIRKNWNMWMGSSRVERFVPLTCREYLPMGVRQDILCQRLHFLNPPKMLKIQ